MCVGRHIDGHDYMWAVSEMLDRAREAIFILVRPSIHPRICSRLHDCITMETGEEGRWARARRSRVRFAL